MTTKPKRVVRLDPMTEAEYAGWVTESIAGYADAQVEAGLWDRETAEQRSRDEFQQLLPHGLATAGHHLWTARDAETDAEAGILWIAVRPKGAEIEAYVYDVLVNPEVQGLGYGRAVMDAGAVAARELGAQTVALNVHGHNERAYSLYKSLGYVVTNRRMQLGL